MEGRGLHQAGCMQERGPEPCCHQGSQCLSRFSERCQAGVHCGFPFDAHPEQYRKVKVSLDCMVKNNCSSDYFYDYEFLMALL